MPRRIVIVRNDTGGNTGGAVGPQGAIGPAGPKGDAGPTGLAGSQGADGADGVKGDIGPKGDAGPTGSQGLAGDAGAIGPVGPTGVKGDIGATGPVGAAGATGPVGAAGPIGPAGAVGAVGAVGPAGAIGAVGPAGAVGAVGAVGPAGAVGAVGAVGAAGPASAVAVQVGNPAVTGAPTIPTPVKGDTVVQTSDGTPTGKLQASFVYNGTVWVQQANLNVPTALASPLLRTYMASTSAWVDRFPVAETAATITARGFTGIGGATITPGSYSSASFAINLNGLPVTAQSAANAANAAIHTVPTVYVQHEVAVTAGSSNVYSLKLKNSLPDQNVDVWICNATTGIPVERLHGNACFRYGGGDAGSAFSLSPDGANGGWNREWEWVNYFIPGSAIAAYSTPGGTVKLAIKKGMAANASAVEVSGYGMSQTGNSWFVTTPVFTMDNQQNGGTALAYSGIVTGNPYATVAASGVALFSTPANIVSGEAIRVSIPSITKDLYVSLVITGNLYGNPAKSLDVTIASSTTGPLRLGRGRPNQVGPLAKDLMLDSGLGSFTGTGWLIPAAVLAAKAIKPPGSIAWYIDLQLTNVSDLAAYVGGFIAETA